jgi:hypothetical protein
MPEFVAADPESAAWLAAADERYANLRTHLFVGLSETCTTDHSGRAADAAAALVLPELKSVYVGYLAAKDEADELRQRVAALEAQAAPDTGGVTLGPCTTCGTPFEACEISADEPTYTVDANGNCDGLCCEDCEHHAVGRPTGCNDECAAAMQWRDTGTLDAIDRAAEAEAELADLTAPTEWGTAGVQWTIGVRQPDGSVIIDTRSPDPDDEVAVRTAFADMQDTNGYRKVLLRRERTAWHEWETDG